MSGRSDFCKEWDVKHSPSSPLYQQANPAERTIQTIKRLFNKAKQDGKDPYLAILAYRSSPLACSKSPAELLFSRQIRSTLPITSKQLEPKVSNKSVLKQKMQTSQVKSKQYYDRSAKAMKPLTLGEGVRIRNGKFWKPAVVKEKLNDRSYVLETQDGGIYRRNRRHLLKSNEKPFQILDPPDITQNCVNSTPSFPISTQARPTEQPTQDSAKENQALLKSSACAC